MPSQPLGPIVSRLPLIHDGHYVQMVLSGGLAVSRLALSHDDHDEFGGILSWSQIKESI